MCILVNIFKKKCKKKCKCSCCCCEETPKFKVGDCVRYNNKARRDISTVYAQNPNYRGRISSIKENVARWGTQMSDVYWLEKCKCDCK